MNVCRSMVLIITLMAVAVPAIAWDDVEVLEADGYITRWVTYRQTPTPGYCDWRPDSPPVQFYSATNADGSGNLACTDQWSVLCDTDSLAYRGAWPAHSAVPIEGTNYESTWTCSVNITADTGMFCSRSVEGNLTESIHSLTLEHPGGEEVIIFPDGPGPNEAQLVLNQGTYLVTMTIFANQTLPGGTFDPYTGNVLVMWGDPNGVAVEPVSWSSLKATFR